MTKLSEDARKLLRSAGVREMADDFIILPDGYNVTVLLSERAVKDLNRQARDQREELHKWDAEA